MNLTIAELAELPLPAAAFDIDDRLIIQTPEWPGLSPGSVSHPVRGNRLVVSAAIPADAPLCSALVGRLLDGLAAAGTACAGRPAARIAMLAASLRLVAGRGVATTGTTHDALQLARAGIAVRTGLDVTVEERPPTPIPGPEAVALVLVQLAANAERHARVTAVTIAETAGAFHVSWTARGGAGEVRTARRRDWRERWGLGFARIAADTLGGAVYPPTDRGDGTVTATFEMGLGRLALPLAVVAGGRVRKATRAWDEETGYPPGHPLGATSRLWAAHRAATEAGGAIVAAGGVCARAVDCRVWMAIPPDGILDRARDVLDGIAHERALWEGVPEPAQSRVFALAGILGARLGRPLPRVPAHAWNRRAAPLWSAFGIAEPPPVLEGIGAVDPRIVAHLTAEVGDGLDVAGEDLRLRVRGDRLTDPLVRALDGGRGVIGLG